MKPIGDHILISPIPEDSELVGPKGTLKLVKAESNKDKPDRGTVISVGKGRILPDGTVRKIELKAGDKVLFSKYAGNSFMIGNDEFLVVSYDDIIVLLD